MTGELPQSVAVAGGGLMGCGIAAVCALVGLPVIVYEDSPERRDRVAATCEATFDDLIGAQVLDAGAAKPAAARVSVTSDIRNLAGCEYVIEAITESLNAKRLLYAALEGVLEARAIIASSTSGFTPDALSNEMKFPQRFLVAHFWNPPHLIPLVEVLAGSSTTSAAVDITMRLMWLCRLEPVLLRKAVPGFIGNRFQFAVLREALHLLRAGVADPATIDAVMRNSLGRRYAHFGPLEGADLGGLETFLRISRHLMPQLSKDEGVLESLEDLVEAGQTGRNSGRGFYKWDARREVHLAHARRTMLRTRLDNWPK